MSKKQAVTVFVDPTVETQLVIKPFAAGLAQVPAAFPQKSLEAADGWTGTASATYVGGNVDADADVDYNG